MDDEPSILDMLRLRLEAMGADVTPAGGGRAAVARARADGPDVILLDIMMPDVDGFAVIDELKNDPETSTIPVIFMTALDEVENRVQGLDLGAHDYVTKPFNTTELIARVRAALRIKVLQDELHEKNRMLEALATSDPLTGLPNRRTFDEQVFLEMERARRADHTLSCLIFDIDQFKAVNDRHGHQAGDDVLRKIGEVLSGRKRAVDVVARYGGEEFVWLLPAADRGDAMELGEWLRRTMERLAITTPEGPIRITVSVGLSTYDPQRHGTVATDSLLGYADRALLEAKARGKNCVVYREIAPLNGALAGGVATGVAAQ